MVHLACVHFRAGSARTGAETSQRFFRLNSAMDSMVDSRSYVHSAECQETNCAAHCRYHQVLAQAAVVKGLVALPRGSSTVPWRRGRRLVGSCHPCSCLLRGTRRGLKGRPATGAGAGEALANGAADAGRGQRYRLFQHGAARLRPERRMALRSAAAEEGGSCKVSWPRSGR
eukprot:s2310_g5.t1